MALTLENTPCLRVIKTREFSELRLADSVYSANGEVPTHAHTHAVFCIALQGLCSEVYAGKVREYRPSTIEFLPPNQCHSLKFARTEMRAFSVSLAPSWLDRARDYSLRLDDSVYEYGGSLSGLAARLYKEFLLEDSASRLSIEGLTMEMMGAVSRRQFKGTDRTPPPWMTKVMELLHSSFSERITLTQLASAADIHPVHLAHEFRRFYRCTIGEYIRKLRVEHACHQLTASKLSLAEIADAAGFSDQSHFSRTFKRLIGTTPAEYRATLGKH